jgi:hypothetical protein
VGEASNFFEIKREGLAIFRANPETILSVETGLDVAVKFSVRDAIGGEIFADVTRASEEFFLAQ